MAVKKKMSFNQTIKDVIEPQIGSAILGPWALDEATREAFFTNADKANPAPALQRIAETSRAQFIEGTPELYLARLIIGGVANFPSKAGEGLGVRTKEYVSAEQKAHDDLKKAAQTAIETFIKQDPTCQALTAAKVNINGSAKCITPKLHMRDAKAVIDSYETATNGGAVAPIPATPVAPVVQQVAEVAQVPQQVMPVQAEAIPAAIPAAPLPPVQAATPIPPAPMMAAAPAPVASSDPVATQVPPVPVLPATPQAAPKKKKSKK